MIIKEMTFELADGADDAFWRAQAVWNEESRDSEGYIGTCQGQADTGEVTVMVFWRSRDHLFRFMRNEHDRIAAMASSTAPYTSMRVRIVEADWVEEPLV